MGFLQGLAAVNEELSKRPSGDFEDKPKARYVKVDDGKSVKLVFLQEIDKGSPNYSEKNGLALFSLEHKNPDNFKKHAKCTADEGACWACEQGWRQSVVLYENVLVDDGNEDPYVAIWNRGIGKGSVAQTLLNMAADEDFDLSVSDKTFKMSRKGTGTDTTYSLDALPKPHKLNVEDYELFDLEKYVFTVSYEKQEAYYLDGQEPKAKEPVAAAAGSTGIDADW